MQRPMFEVRLRADGLYVIDAVWPDSETEELAATFSTPELAENWVNEHSEAYVNASVAARRSAST
jgi:hypothetical protein